MRQFAVELDFRPAFYTAAILLAITMLIILWKLPDRVKSSKVQNKEAQPGLMTVVKKINSLATNLFFVENFLIGFLTGITANQVVLYLQDVLGATADMIGNSVAISMVVGIVLVPFQTKLVKLMGVFNIMLLSLIVASSRMLIYSFVK